MSNPHLSEIREKARASVSLPQDEWAKLPRTAQDEVIIDYLAERLADELTDGVKPRTFTVILLYPEHSTGAHGLDTYVESTTADTPEEAVAKVQAMASEANNGNIEPSEFLPTLVLRGDVEVVLDGADMEGATEETGEDNAPPPSGPVFRGYVETEILKMLDSHGRDEDGEDPEAGSPSM